MKKHSTKWRQSETETKEEKKIGRNTEQNSKPKQNKSKDFASQSMMLSSHILSQTVLENPIVYKEKHRKTTENAKEKDKNDD